MFKQKTKYQSMFLLVFCLAPAIIYAQLDDPTRPPGYRLALPDGSKAAARIKFSLSAVRISSLRRSVVINDRLVEVGDTVNGAKVIAIYPAAAKLKKQGKVFTVRLTSYAVKKTRRH